MSDAVNHEKGFSLPETLLAMTLLVMVVTALGGYQRGLANGFIQLNQYRQLWRDAWRYGQMNPPETPCVSITVTITMPVDKRVQMTRLHCPVSQ